MGIVMDEKDSETKRVIEWQTSNRFLLPEHFGEKDEAYFLNQLDLAIWNVCEAFDVEILEHKENEHGRSDQNTNT